MKINTPPLSRKTLAQKALPVVAALPLLGFACAGVAHAASQTQSHTFTPASTDFTTGTNFNLFNPALGTLTEVDWTVAINNANVNGSVKNNAPSAQNFKITEETDFTASGAGTGTINTNPLITTQTYTGLASAASAAFGPFTPSSSAATTLTGPDVAGYVGAGTFNFGLSSLTGTNILGGGGNISANITTTAGATATVTYVYTASAAAPEPSSLTLFALPVLSAMGVVLRRRRA